MIQCNETILQQMLNEYQHSFVENFNGESNEKFKWVALKQFQDNWDIDAQNFKEMFLLATSKHVNLLNSGHFFARRMISEFIDIDTDRVRNMFDVLYNEDLTLAERIKFFENESVELLKLHPNNARNHFQDLRAISTYLWLRYPSKYYIRKSREYNKILNLLEIAQPKVSKDAEYYAQSLEVNDYLREKLINQKELINTYNKLLTEDCYKDDDFHTLTIDFVFFAGRRYESAMERKSNKTAEQTIEQLSIHPNAEKRYWWLTGSPKYWSPTLDWKLGTDVDYTLYNDKGNQRHIFKHFFEAKPGDDVIVYESTPTLQIVALGRVVTETDGEIIYIRKMEELSAPIPYSEILNNPILKNSEPVKNRCQGSLFRLTEEEYEETMRLIRMNIYSDADFLKEVFLDNEELQTLKTLLENKKNIILQGAPGVGKTFAAKRLAYTLMGKKADENIIQIQFHQNYSYEDFVQGYKPNGNGFELKNGKFYQLCEEAKKNPTEKYFFIIDEINRGNLSKIFGELLMLIEKDYRGENHAIKLTYSDEEFYVPENLYIIGMMNTADRSLALIDYALRRRFCFFEMKPAFDKNSFKEYQRTLNDALFDTTIKKIQELNNVINNDETLGESFVIGHSYFCYNEGTQVDKQLLFNTITYDILPTLKEYWFDNNKKYTDWEQNLMNLFDGEK